MREITREDLVDLEQVILGATPGPWTLDGDQIRTQGVLGSAPVMDERKNVYYAAVFDPEVTEGLLAYIKEREAEVAGLVTAVVLLTKTLTEKENQLTEANRKLASSA